MSTILILMFACTNPQQTTCIKTCDKTYRPLPSIEEIPNYCVEKINSQKNIDKQTQEDCKKERIIEIIQYDRKYISCLADCERKYP